MPAYQDTQLFINGVWGPAASGRTLPVVNPATHAEIGKVAYAEKADLERRKPPPNAEFQPAAAQLIEHAGLFDEAQRIMHRQHVDAGTEAKPPRALRDRG